MNDCFLQRGLGTTNITYSLSHECDGNIWCDKHGMHVKSFVCVCVIEVKVWGINKLGEVGMHTIYYCSSIRSQQRLSVPYKYISMLHTLQDDSLGRSDENTKKKTNGSSVDCWINALLFGYVIAQKPISSIDALLFRQLTYFVLLEW